MVDWDAFFVGLGMIANLKIMGLMVLGITFGLLLGVTPGLTGAIGIAVATPITFLLDPLSALVLLTSIYTGGLTGGGITAILINTPGAPAAIATTFDGYPLAKKGHSSQALGLGITSSVIGGFFSYVCLLFLIYPIVSFSLKFGPSEMLFLTIFVIVLIGIVGAKSFSKAIFMGIFGLLVGTIGVSDVTGVARGTMGLISLEDGIPTLICIIGIYAIPELISLVTKDFVVEDGSSVKLQGLKGIFEGVKLTFKYKVTLIRSAILGFTIGSLPAAGSTVASLLSYSQAKSRAKPGQKFGEGEPEGVVAAETANNASEGGAMAILLALGIPGSASTALLIAAFMLHGLMPGPRLLIDHGPLIYGLIASNLIQLILLGFIAIIVASFLSRVIFIPTKIIAPALIVIMAIGAFSVRYLVFDFYLLIFFGILGWFFRSNDFPMASFIIGFILGGTIDTEVYKYKVLFGTDLSVLYTRPIAGVLFFLTFALIFNMIYSNVKTRIAKVKELS